MIGDESASVPAGRAAGARRRRSTWPAASSPTPGSRSTTAGTSPRRPPALRDRGGDRAAAQRSSRATRSPDIPFDRSINPYRGCEHGCIYCFARPSHAYLGLSPGLDFETRLIAKPDAPKVLAAELRAAAATAPAPIAIGTNTDPYQPIEKRFGIMRGILEVLRDFRHPVTIVTKGALIERDADILGEMAARRPGARSALSVTTLDRELARGDGAARGGAGAPARGDPPRWPRPACPVRVSSAPMIPGAQRPRDRGAARGGARRRRDAAPATSSLRLPREVGAALPRLAGERTIPTARRG